MKNPRGGSCPRRKISTDLTHDPATSSAFVSCLSKSLLTLSDPFNVDFSIVMIFRYFVVVYFMMAYIISCTFFLNVKVIMKFVSSVILFVLSAVCIAMRKRSCYRSSLMAFCTYLCYFEIIVSIIAPDVDAVAVI